MAAIAAATQAAATVLLLAALVLAAGPGGARAQSASPSSQCTSALVSLSPCLSYISGNVSAAPPSCCAQLGKVVQSDPQCLCVALSADPASLGLTVNRTRALGLPDACKVTTPDVSNCKGAAAAAGERLWRRPRGRRRRPRGLRRRPPRRPCPVPPRRRVAPLPVSSPASSSPRPSSLASPRDPALASVPFVRVGIAAEFVLFVSSVVVVHL
ncbi:Non-specific lipid-transfer protein-like protein [Zea mays]|uniref:Non-specific lipid-transfer protein-like protein n=1 Tax=Zea mays TaxID=4577 RepID=A0A3L6FRM8_MAIZE|nr:Non-specific lipid-transfer protein-like protein [Zea mays]